MGPQTSNASARPPAVAGLFYPSDAVELRDLVRSLLDAERAKVQLPHPPKALIVPHAGYPYSGTVAAAAYALLRPLRSTIKRVVIIGPSHRVYLQGIALPRVDAFATPLGEVPLDEPGRTLLLKRGDVLAADAPHAMEHCLEVQLPFLQTVLDEFTLLPLVVGVTHSESIADVLSAVWGDAETLVLASSDLSHYLPYDFARSTDAVTANAILERDASLSHQQACGADAINGLLTVARRLNLEVSEIARLNSGDTSGDLRRVVGYGAFAIHEPVTH